MGRGRLAGAALAAVHAADLVIAADGARAGCWPRYRAPLSSGRSRILCPQGDRSPPHVRRLPGPQRHPAAKDATDTELAIALALGQGATDIDLVGATGGARLDHSLANVLLLAADWPAGVRLRLVEAAATALVVRAGQSVDVPGTVGDIVALLPLAGPGPRDHYRGLQYALAGEDLAFGRARGVSNVMTDPVASISVPPACCSSSTSIPTDLRHCHAQPPKPRWHTSARRYKPTKECFTWPGTSSLVGPQPAAHPAHQYWQPYSDGR